MNVDAMYETVPSSVTRETVTFVRHWTDELFELRVTRPASLRFRSGEFIMLGLMVEGKPLLRAYSIASPTWDEELDFYSIKVQAGPLTSRLQHIRVGDPILLGRKPVGTLVLDALRPGKRLYLFSTGTGVAPFASIVREPETYEKFEAVILTHTCRLPADLAFSKHLVETACDDELIGEMARAKLVYYPSVTRDGNFPTRGRITDLMTNGQLFRDLGAPPLNPEHDRAMICGSAAMLADTKALLEQAGLQEGANSRPGDFVIEKAFVG
jgi:ferredoxin/flavodoxin---NADP+ reductase